MNVFTIVDDFEYPDESSPTKKSRLSAATADYFVLGFHTDEGSDPFSTTAKPDNLKQREKEEFKKDPTKKPTKEPTHAQRLNTLNMTLKEEPVNDSSDDPINKWLRADAHSRLICHASMYDVVFNRLRHPSTVLAQAAAQQRFGIGSQ
jgi:hypothetical protein